jgi:hypothetical protein
MIPYGCPITSAAVDSLPIAAIALCLAVRQNLLIFRTLKNKITGANNVLILLNKVTSTINVKKKNFRVIAKLKFT